MDLFIDLTLLSNPTSSNWISDEIIPGKPNNKIHYHAQLSQFQVVPGETSLACHRIAGSPAFLMKLGVAWG